MKFMLARAAAVLLLAPAAGCGEGDIRYEPDRAALSTVHPETARRGAELLLATERRADARTARRVTPQAIEFNEGERRYTVPLGAIRPVIAHREGFFEVSTAQGTTFAWRTLEDARIFLDDIEVVRTRGGAAPP